MPLDLYPTHLFFLELPLQNQAGLQTAKNPTVFGIIFQVAEKIDL